MPSITYKLIGYYIATYCYSALRTLTIYNHLASFTKVFSIECPESFNYCIQLLSTGKVHVMCH